MERAIKNAFIKMKRQEGVKFAAKAIGCGADPFEILKICREIQLPPLRPIAIVQELAITP